MTYSSGGLIEATDYNNRATNLNSYWGTGAGANGYGQSTTLSNVAVTNTVAATNWATLVTRLDSIKAHQFGNTSAITGPTAGGVITYLSTIDTQLSMIGTNKLLFNATRATALPTTLGNPVMSSSTGWTTSCTKEFSVTFTSTNTVRYFFNAGGIITFYMTQTGGTTTKSSDWSTFLTNTVGTISFGSNYCSRSGTGGDQGSATPGGSPTLNTSVGFHSLTTSYQTLFAIGSTSATADYGNNYITVEAKVGGALYGASSNIVSFRVIMYDAAADVNFDLVDGTTAVYVGMTPPEVTNLANTWSFPTAATVTNTQNTLATTTAIDYLLVGGGGGGGLGIFNRSNGGGGGGGGTLYNSAVAVSAATQYNISVGGAGSAGTGTTNTAVRGGTGTNTTFSLGTVTAYGGGGGGSYRSPALTGGSSGGGASINDGVVGYAPPPTGTGQGYGGGQAQSESGVNSAAAGGGGAGGLGMDGSGPGAGQGGWGGAGRSQSITGSAVIYGAGGGGSGQGGPGGAGGSSNSGGNGATYSAAGTAAQDGQGIGAGGGGGAGGSNNTASEGNGGAGFRGVAIVRYSDIYANASATTGSPTFSQTGGFKIYTWTGVGSITF